ncbi:conserved protein, unknown function [Plasmodium chabaudi chabaudi]|uniref:Trafficking protein particle complex subunit 13 N-terminal domain-containing protein n=1 Tax=Plasmodium chabaudi chabaudi TaxID=31271 RepID=A0A1C6YIP5_PLACU|nr:conserved protein, unknown function [Plasmodium chabaudi chabaudi]SCN60793.1 conserved protein, unknown function [Plasmodium chabaudi chabaudi]
MSEAKDGIQVELFRLSPPVLNHNIWNLFKIKEIEHTDFGKSANNDDVSLSNEFSFGLPTNSRKIYYGQNFTSQINISNNFKSDIQIGEINLDVVTKENMFNIHKKNEDINIPPTGFFNFITSFVVNFLDIFVIHCTVDYFVENEPQKIRKEFNFISMDPFCIKSVILQKMDKLYIELRLKNLEDNNIMVNDIRLKDICYETIKNEEGGFKTHNGLHYFKKNDEYSMIFCVNDEKSKLNILNKEKDENITNIEIIYFSNDGGKGINTMHFLKKCMITDNLRIYLLESENPFYLINKIYKFEIVFENNTNENILIEILIHNNFNIHVVNNFVKAHTIEGKKKVSHFFDVLFINPGIHFFNKITIYNKKTKKKIDYIKLFKLFVK